MLIGSRINKREDHVHFMNQHTNIMTDNLTQYLIDLCIFSLAFQGVTKLCLYHVEVIGMTYDAVVQFNKILLPVFLIVLL